jgi:hypothetical protein
MNSENQITEIKTADDRKETPKMKQMTGSDNVDSRWRSLCKPGGVSALAISVLLPGEIFVYAVWPRPGTVIESERQHW